jgi:serine protease Do
MRVDESSADILLCGMPRRTHYQVLGVSRDASSIDIANAVRDKLAELKAKPASGAAEDAVREAYQVLANPDLRAEYDAGLPPDAAMLAAQKAAAKGPGAVDFMKDVAQEAGLVKVVIPIAVILAIAVVWYKTRPDPKPPTVVPISRTITPPMRRDDAKPAQEAQSTMLEPAPTPSAPAPSAPNGAEEVFSAVSPSVARIQTFDASGRMLGQGSGVATGNSIVITNCHVVTGAARLSVKVAGTVHDGVVQIADRQLDLCSLRVAGLEASPVAIATNEVRVGQHVYAIGAPQGLELTLSEGIVSSLRGTTKGTIIQTTAPVSPGSSGGGLFDTNGKLVGIVTFQHKTGQNLNFALPASWIFEMQDRESTEDVAAPVARTADTPQ